MKIAAITIFPEIFEALDYGIIGRAKEQALFQLHLYNPRDYTTSKHRRVDDVVYGGGAGMLLQTQPLQGAIQAAKQQLPAPQTVIYLTPTGKPFTQQTAKSLANKNLIFVCGRYEGIDQRIIANLIDEEISLGDFILTGGEFAALAVIDAIVRLQPNVLGDAESLQSESFEAGLLEYPHYTRPQEIAGLSVPAVLVSGDQAAITRYRLKQALGQTWLKRPDMLKQRDFSQLEQDLLAEFIVEYVAHFGRRKS